MALTKVTGQVVNTSTDLTVGVLTATTVSVGGTLTYEDVTNVDSVGLITARNGISVTGSNISVESSEDRLLYLKSTDANAYLTFEDTDSSSGFANRIGSVSDGLYFSTGGGGERARIDSSGRIGIGMVPHTSSTGYALQIDGGASSFIQIFNDTSGNTVNDGFVIGNDANTAYLVNKENTPLVFRTNNTERLRIDSSGRLLHGTTSSSVAASAIFEGNSSNAAGAGVIYLNRGTGSMTAGLEMGFIRFGDQDENVGALIEAEADGTWASNDYPGRILFSTTADGGSSPTERIRITSSGDLCFGSTVGANNDGSGISIYNASFPRLSFRNSTTGNATSDGSQIYLVNSDLYVTNNENANLILRTNSTERMRIDSSGNMGLGTDSPTTGNSGGRFIHIHNTATDANRPSEIVFTNGSTGTTGGSGGTITYYQDDLYTWNYEAQDLIFGTNATERMRIDSSGKMGLGTASPTADGLHIVNSTQPDLFMGTSANAEGFKIVYNNTDSVIGNVTSTPLRFVVGNSEKARIDSSGRLLVGATSTASSAVGRIISRNDVDYSSTQFEDNATLCLQNETNANPAVLLFHSNDSGGSSGRAAIVGGNVEGTNNQLGFYGNASNLTTSTDPDVLIDSSGRLVVGKASASANSNGAELRNGSSEYAGTFSASSHVVMLANRNTDDGVVIRIRGQGNDEGSISVSGSTVSYNGAHLARWSQLPGGAERTEILRGSVLSNLDEMCEWGEEDNEQLNRMKVSDVEGDINVAGVFQAWDDDDDTYTNDFYCAMTGDFVIRIASGVTVQRGNLLMSAGDGTAKPQGDGYIQDKTIAKVTSTTVSTTYSDGSYCVPCVLMAC